MRNNPGNYLQLLHFTCGWYHQAVGTGQIHQKIVIVIIRKSQCALYFRGLMHKTCFIIKLNHLVPKDDDNHCGNGMTSTVVGR